MKGKPGSNVPMQPNIPPMPTNTSNALEALDSVNATQSNTLDCISRKAAIDKFEPWLKVEGYSHGEKNMLKAVLYELHCIPPATQPESDSGRWERHYSRPGVYADLCWHCSKCGYKTDYQYANVNHRYCPNCGAKMEG